MKNSNSDEQVNIKSYLTTLEDLSPIEDYQQLGHYLKAICNITQTALLAEMHYPELTEHSTHDLFCLINLAQKLIPEEEFELLDELNK